MTTLPPFDSIMGSMYLSEVRDLVQGIRDAIDDMRVESIRWVNQHEVSGAEAAAHPAAFDRGRFESALHESRAAQGNAFFAVEALLARWARLSLLFFPIAGAGPRGEWRQVRGASLRHLAAVSNESLLASRDVRDAWMHYDKRMDDAAINGRLGNRQQFVSSAGVASAINVCARVIDMERLTFHFRTRDGAPFSAAVASMEAALAEVEAGLSSAATRFEALPDPPGRAVSE